MVRNDTAFGHELIESMVAVRNRMEWNPAKLETLPTRLMCVISELDEFEDALLEFGAFEPSIVTAHAKEELADVSIYLALTLFDLRGGMWPHRSVHRSSVRAPWQDVCRITKPARSALVGAMQSWRYVDRPGRLEEVCISLEIALLEVVRIACALHIELDEAILVKIEKLYQRGPRNGGKHPDS